MAVVSSQVTNGPFPLMEIKIKLSTCTWIKLHQVSTTSLFERISDGVSSCWTFLTHAEFLFFFLISDILVWLHNNSDMELKLVKIQIILTRFKNLGPLQTTVWIKHFQKELQF